MDQAALDRMTRDALIGKAKSLGVQRPELMTRVELKDEILRLAESDETAKRQARGWLGVARDMVASVVEAGLHLPDAAAVIRGEARFDAKVGQRQVATVTLAEIYAAQGHVERALGILEEVLKAEPDHQAAREVLERLKASGGARSGPAPHGLGVLARPARPEPEAIPAVEAKPKTEPEADQEPKAELDTEPEPAKADDAAVALRVSPRRTLVYLELSRATLRKLDTRDTERQLVIRVVEVEPSWDGASRHERDVGVSPQSSLCEIDDLAESAVVRMALGLRDATRFQPLAVLSSLLPGSSPNDAVVLWAPEPRSGRSLSEVEKRALERFFGDARK